MEAWSASPIARVKNWSLKRLVFKEDALGSGTRANPSPCSVPPTPRPAPPTSHPAPPISMLCPTHPSSCLTHLPPCSTHLHALSLSRPPCPIHLLTLPHPPPHPPVSGATRARAWCTAWRTISPIAKVLCGCVPCLFSASVTADCMWYMACSTAARRLASATHCLCRSSGDGEGEKGRVSGAWWGRRMMEEG